MYTFYLYAYKTILAKNYFILSDSSKLLDLRFIFQRNKTFADYLSSQSTVW